MPRKIRPTTRKDGKFRIERPVTPEGFETGDPWKDGALWMSRVMKTLNARVNSENGDRAWTAYYNWFNGDQWLHEGSTPKGDWELYSDTISSVYTNNLVQSQASAYMPFLLNGEIAFKVKARKPQDVNAAELQTALLNYEWNERSMTEEVKKIIDDVVIIGWGVGRTEYVVEVDESKYKGENIEYRDYVRKDAAFIERVSPFDFIHDLSARDGTLKTARFCAERSYHVLQDLMANRRYDKDVLNMVYAGGGGYPLSMRSAFSTQGGKPYDVFSSSDMMVRTPEDSLIPIWTIWDKRTRKVITMPEGLPHPLEVIDWPYPYLDGFPFVMIPFLRAPGHVYPIGVARQLKDAQLQANRIRTQQIQNVRAQKNMYGADTNKVQKEELQDFADLPPLSVIPMQGQDGIFPIANPPMSRDLLLMGQALQADAQVATGADALFQGQALPDRTTAAEIGTRTNLLRLKADDKVSNVERGVTDLARQVLAHLKANRVQDDVIEIAGLLGSQWRQYTADEIQAETDVSVSYFSAPKYDPAVERQQKTQVLQLAVQAAPVMQQTGQPAQINFTELFGWVLGGFEDIKDAGRFFSPALVVQPPLEQTEASQAGAGLPPALAGGLAPGAVPTQPTNGGQPGEGLSIQDLMMQLSGQAGQPGSLPQP